MQSPPCSGPLSMHAADCCWQLGGSRAGAVVGGSTSAAWLGVQAAGAEL